MGVSPALGRALTLDASHRWAFPLEFPLASIFPFGSRNLRSGSAANDAPISDRGYNGSRSRRFDVYCDVHPVCNRHLRFTSDMEFTRVRGDLVVVNALVA